MTTTPTSAAPSVAPSTEPWLKHVPVPLFAATMGLAGLGLAWRKAHEVLLLPQAIGEVILVLAALAFIGTLVLYAAKAAKFTPAMVGEFTHPIRSSFFPALSIGILLLASALLPYAKGAAEGLWIVGTVLHLVFAVSILNRWIVHNHEIGHSSPAWFIPVVGNIIVPLAGVKLGYEEVSIFFFSVGMVFWVILFVLVVNRIIFHDQLPGKFLPTLFILVAPPAVGFLSYLSVNGGEIDLMAKVLFFTALFLAIMLASMIRLFMGLPFALSWWAYTFPSAAMTMAALRYHELSPSAVTVPMAVFFLVVATIIIAMVAFKTTVALIKGKVFVPEG